jgi:hypothetical protein
VSASGGRSINFTFFEIMTKLSTCLEVTTYLSVPVFHLLVLEKRFVEVEVDFSTVKLLTMYLQSNFGCKDLSAAGMSSRLFYWFEALEYFVFIGNVELV